MKPGPLMFDLEGAELTNEERDLLCHPAIGGVIFFARNFVNREQIHFLSGAIRDIRPDILLAVDQEGGRVQRFKEGFTAFPPMARLGQLLQADSDEGGRLLRDCGWLLAAEVIASGVDFSFAPVLDVDDKHCEVIANRAFSNDPAIVIRAARLFIAGMHEAGMAATGKHFPGHGGVVADSHLETPEDGRNLDSLLRRDLIPFVDLRGELDAVMPAHILFPRIDRHCVGFSDHWLREILRGKLGFEGVIFSDDLSMKGADAAGSYADKAKAALGAGCDMILVCNNREGVRETLDYLEAAQVASSQRLPVMTAKKSWNWEKLVNDQRRLSVHSRLAALN